MRTFGIELETASRWGREDISCWLKDHGLNAEMAEHSGRDYKLWQVKPDATIRVNRRHPHRVELVSPVLDWPQGNRQIKTMLLAVRKHATINDSCGLHVHVGVQDLERRHFQRLRKLWRAVEWVVTSSLPRKRRANDQCKRGVGHRSKYYALNMMPMWVRGTVEFRCHHATMNYRKIVSWVAFCVALVDYARSDSPIPAIMRPELLTTVFHIPPTKVGKIVADCLAMDLSRERIVARVRDEIPEIYFGTGKLTRQISAFRRRGILGSNTDSMTHVCALLGVQPEHISVLSENFKRMVRFFGKPPEAVSTGDSPRPRPRPQRPWTPAARVEEWASSRIAVHFATGSNGHGNFILSTDTSTTTTSTTTDGTEGR